MTNFPNAIVISGGHICLLENNKLKIIKQAKSWGITWDEDSVYTTTNSSNIDKHHKGKTTRLSYGGEYLHQIYYHPKNKSIYVCNTKNDRIDEFALSSKLCTLTKKHTKVGDHPKSNRLINSIWNDKQGHFWVNEHWKRQRNSCLKKYDENFSNVLDSHDIGMCNHNVFVYDNKLITLNSDAGTIICKNLKTEKVVETKFDPITSGLSKNHTFLRGLAFNGEHFLIGVTVFHNNRGKRGAPGSIILYDKHFNLINHLMAPEVVTDIRIFKDDIAHNGINFPGF